MWGSVSIMVESPSLNFFQQRYPTRPLLPTGAVSVLPPSRTFHTLSPSPQSTARGTDSHKGVSAHPESSLIGLLSLPPSQPRREHWSSPLALGCAPSSSGSTWVPVRSLHPLRPRPLAATPPSPHPALTIPVVPVVLRALKETPSSQYDPECTFRSSQAQNMLIIP